jgi:hypothetical protein
MVTGSVAIDVAIGLMLLYLLLSAGASALYEIGAQLLAKQRGKMLVDHLKSVFLGPPGSASSASLFKDFINHPLIDGLRQGADPKRNPAYIAPATFAHALLDAVDRAGTNAQYVVRTAAQFASALGKLPDCPVKKSLQALLAAANGDMTLFQAKLEAWYNDLSDRMSGWYKRKAQMFLLIIGFLLATLFNADTIMIARLLTRDPALRQTVVAAAQERVKADAAKAGSGNSAADTDVAATIKSVQASVEKGGFPIGWSKDEDSPNRLPCCGKCWTPSQWMSKVLGLLVTALAVSLGASYWFDLMSKLVNLRAAGPKPPSTPKPTK